MMGRGFGNDVASAVISILKRLINAGVAFTSVKCVLVFSLFREFQRICNRSSYKTVCLASWRIAAGLIYNQRDFETDISRARHVKAFRICNRRLFD
ncbi:hypothetical protein KS4_26570 [Poriferisphaera corsica]|uniref:Uncharacterized protein n=1 Tax=Poriferisphaera corsica TaxID=2528020 RepID=A0A517YWI5_9BACT|nr:hypothetical protein KS4_26570 [Poriferisphaera corsica]